MILGALIKFIKNVIDGFSAVCAFLLIKLKLWISVVFALLFIIICAFTGIELKGETVNYFIGGIVACFALALIINVLTYYKKTAKKNPGQPNVARIKMRGDIEDYGASESFVPLEKTETVPDGKRYSYTSYTEPVESRKKNAAEPRLSGLSLTKNKYDDFADLKKKYFEAQSADEHTQNDTPYERAQAYDAGLPEDNRYAEHALNTQKETDRRFDADKPAAERPMVFAMRQDPDVLIYEFSDRLVFYRKTKRGLICENVEYKS